MIMRHPYRLPMVLAACVAASLAGTGCSSVLDAGLRALADGGERRGTSSVYEVAPTNEWQTSSLSRPYTPTQSIFGAFAPHRVVCQAMPVGLARIHAVPTGPAASPIVRLGPLEFGAAGPDGALEDALAMDSWSLTSRAFRSGARMAGNGPTCGNRLFFYVSIGGGGSEVNVLR